MGSTSTSDKAEDLSLYMTLAVEQDVKPNLDFYRRTTQWWGTQCTELTEQVVDKWILSRDEIGLYSRVVGFEWIGEYAMVISGLICVDSGFIYHYNTTNVKLNGVILYSFTVKAVAF